MPMIESEVTSMDSQTEKIRAAALEPLPAPDLPVFEVLYGNLESAADKVVALLTLERKERAVSIAERIHALCGDLARTYHDEEASK